MYNLNLLTLSITLIQYKYMESEIKCLVNPFIVCFWKSYCKDTTFCAFLQFSCALLSFFSTKTALCGAKTAKSDRKSVALPSPHHTLSPKKPHRAWKTKKQQMLADKVSCTEKNNYFCRQYWIFWRPHSTFHNIGTDMKRAQDIRQTNHIIYIY